ncbi:transporter substrate-binding domain-containing protein [Vibrio sp. CAU 1672]|uniref:transporter substrate-binding domain-containing protein n=1 Tax=Vibrio sp. CAU 1672 TaxID=3032594 RepID=UPI0023DB56AA|nr:transporter substrate-binding domain-containing protein [Vibrio sp. CAU 1672]MDF2152981.1 transporter substrate-binding domain-containing protein [Vibrio sp. CAU 1672]
MRCLSMRFFLCRFSVGLLLCAGCFLAGPSQAQTLKVGTYPCPPFVITSPSADYDGLSIQLWDQIASHLDVKIEYQHYPLKQLLSAIENNDIDIGVSCISITPERELYADFSHSFYETHLAIAVKNQGYWNVIASIATNSKLWFIILAIACFAAIVGAVFYYLERKTNDKLYSAKSRFGQVIEGFILGLFFVTRGPFNYFEFRTLPGRVLAVLMAVFTTLFIASITALLASKLTLEQTNLQIRGINDLANVTVGAKVATTASRLLSAFSIRHQTYEDAESLLRALEREEVEAVVADDVVLKYMIGSAKANGQYLHLEVLPYQLEKQNYGFILTENNRYEEEINRALLQIRESREWRRTLIDYFAEH